MRSRSTEVTTRTVIRPVWWLIQVDLAVDRCGLHFGRRQDSRLRLHDMRF